MNPAIPQFMYVLEVALFASVIFLHLAKKSSLAVTLYVGQSIIIAGLLFYSAFRDASVPLALTAFAVLAVKAVVAPYFIRRLIAAHELKFTASTYLNAPLTLLALAVITAFSFSNLLKPFAVMNGANGSLPLLAIAMIFASVFLIVNHKDALSQMIGILSLENSIVLFAFVTGLEQAPSLELGIIFDLLVWILIATIFISMVYRRFGTLDVSEMKHLKEE
jgi:hydrogenase-4 component E